MAEPSTTALPPNQVSFAELLALRASAHSLSFAAITVRDARGGAHLSRFRGRGMEFEESRPYQAGDDLRTMDWRVTARTGKPYSKVFSEDRDRPVLVWCDLRSAMMFATRRRFKAVRAAQLAALVGWTALAGGNRFGGLLFDDAGHREFRPALGRRGVLAMLNYLATCPAWTHKGESSPDACRLALERLLRVARPGSLVFLLSDFRGLDESGAKALGQLNRHCDIVAVPISDPIERELPPPGDYRIITGRGVRELSTAAATSRHAYAEAFGERMMPLEQLRDRPGFYLLSCSTEDEPLDVLLQSFSG